MSGRACVSWLLAVFCFLAMAPPAAGADLDYDLPNGHFYKQANGHGGAGDTGFAVVDDAAAPFWSEFKRLGGVGAIGYPVSHRFTWDGFLVQAFQKAVFQWRPEVRQVYFVNVFDRLAAEGKDPWLEAYRQTPPSFDHSADADLGWDGVVKRHLAFLEANPAIRAKYLTDPDPILHFGLPMSYRDYDSVFVARAQRAVFQQWKVDVSWAKAGEVVVANGGDVAKEAGLYPSAATTPGAPGTVGGVDEWTRRLVAGIKASARAVAVDRAGGVYVAGSTMGTVEGRDRVGQGGAFLRKYSPSGDDLWTRQFGESTRAGDDRATSIAVDGAGDVYVAGETHLGSVESPGARATFLRKYDASGNVVWSRVFGSVGRLGVSSSPVGLGVDDAGRAYLAGIIFGPWQGQCCSRLGSFVRGYDASGRELWTWTRELDRPDTEAAAAATVDGSGNVYVGGVSEGDSFVRKLDSNGNEVWARRLRVRDTLSGFERVIGLAADRLGSVYMAGVASGSQLSESRSGAWAAFVRKLDGDGREVWTRQFKLGGSASGNGTSASALALTRADRLLVAGTTGYPGSPPGGTDVFVRVYDPSGAELGTRKLATPDREVAGGVAVDAQGYIYVAGWTWHLAQTTGPASEVFVARLAPIGAGP